MEVQFSKNPIIRSHSAYNEIYIGRKKPLKVYFQRMEKLLDEGTNEIIIHGTGMAIPSVLDFYTQYCSLFKRSIIQTSSVVVADEVNEEVRIRTIPAIHIALIVK